MKFLLLILKNLRRNKLRSILTSLAVVLLVGVFTMIATVLAFISDFTTESARDVKLIVNERYRFPSRFPRSFVDQIVNPGNTLNSQLRQIPGFHSEQYTIWQFIGFNLDPEMKDKAQAFFAIATIPEKIPVMTYNLGSFDIEACARVKDPPRTRLRNIGLIMGAERLKRLNKNVGDVFRARSVTHHEGSGSRLPIEMEFEIVGEFPADSQWAGLAMMDYEYLDRVLREKKSENHGTVYVAWLMVDDQQTAAEVSRVIEGYNRDMRCETLASAVARALEPQQDFLRGLKYVIVPAILIVMALIILNAIGITVRERTTEMAVLKVLGFGRGRILALVLGEAVLVGLLAGLAGGGLTHGAIRAMGGLRLGDGPPFFVAAEAWWWGPAIGGLTALIAGLIPAWNAGRVKVAEVFAKVA